MKTTDRKTGQKRKMSRQAEPQPKKPTDGASAMKSSSTFPTPGPDTAGMPSASPPPPSERYPMKRLSLTVEQSPIAFIITDLAGTIEYANPAFEASCGYTLAELMGQNVRMLCAGKTPRAIYDDLWRTLEAGQV
ncbi:MAG: PAS domain S-box protein, partial [Azovibrio sp.]|nr:PAS domain S-box protein [Azovibrio sp.]